MARTILPLAGAFVGSFFGAPQLGFAIGSVIGNAVDPQRIKGPRIGDANVQTSQEGAPRPIVYGTAAVMGNLIDRGPLNKVITEERQGKGGGPVVESESLFMTFAIRICEGPVGGLLRIWEDEKLVYDVRPESEIAQDSARYAEGFALYLGGEDQMPDPDLETIHGVGNTPAHRGTCYIVFREKNLTERRGSIPQFRFEVDRCPPPLPVIPEWVLKIGPNNENPSISLGIFQSPDGLDWTSDVPVASGLPLEYANPGYDGTILITSNGNTARMYSGDAGATFSSILTGGPSLSAGGGRVTKIGSTWYRAGGQSFRIAASSDNGATFAEASLDNNSRVQDIVATSGGRLVGVTEGEVTYVSDDAGASWQAKPNLVTGGFPTGFISIERVRKTGTLVATCISSLVGRISISRDNGETWTAAEYEFPSDDGDIVGFAEWGDGLIAIGSQAGTIAISTDDGTSFYTSSFTFPTTLRSMSGDSSKLIACGNSGNLWVTFDGTNWTSLSNPYGTSDILWVTQVP